MATITDAQALPSAGISPEQHTELAVWRSKDLRYTTEKEFDWDDIESPDDHASVHGRFRVFTIARDLPRIGYVTFLDAVFLASFAFCFFCIIEITTVFLMQKAGMRAPAVKLHFAGKWAYPLAYFLILLFLAICFMA